MTMRFISTKVHGIIDYLTAAMLPVLPRAMGWDRPVTRVHDATAVAATGWSLMTNYELGAAKVLPMKGHLALDAASGLTLLTLAGLMDDEDLSARLAMAGLGVFSLTMALCTKTHSPNELRQKLHRQIRMEASMPVARPVVAESQQPFAYPTPS